MGADSPAAKSKPKLPASHMGSSVGYLPPAVPRQREPYLYPFKLPLVAATLTALATVALSPFPRYQNLLWMLVFFSSCSLLSVFCQAIRMITVVRRWVGVAWLLINAMCAILAAAAAGSGTGLPRSWLAVGETPLVGSLVQHSLLSSCILFV